MSARGGWREAAAAALGISLALVPSPAHADDEEPVRFTYHAPASCPDLQELEARITARTTRFVVRDTPDTREFRVEVTGRAPSRGTLTVVDARGRAARRAFTGATCDEVVSALALAAALAIDPLARATPTPPAPTTPPPPDPPPPAPRPVAPPPPALPPVDLRLAAPAPSPAPGERPALSGARTSIGASTGVVWPAAPNPLVSAGVFAGLTLRGDLEPTLRLALDVATSRDQQQGQGRVAFSRATGAALGCLTLLRPWGARGVGFGACARFEAGVFRAEAADVTAATSSARPWLAPGAGVLARAPLGTGLFLELEVGATAPLWRDDYRLLPDIDVTRIPAVSGGARLAFGYDLPS